MDISDASVEELLLAIEKKKVEYESYKFKYWKIFIPKNLYSEIVLAEDETSAKTKISKFTDISHDDINATLIYPSDFNELIANAKSYHERLESIKTKFKKLNDVV